MAQTPQNPKYKGYIVNYFKISTNEKSQGLRNVLDDFWNKCEAEKIKLESERAIVW